MESFELVEIFESFQGEGRNAGRQCVFIRFAGCNLACPWCDTERTARFSATLDEIMSEVRSHRVRSVILTGGEPTIVRGIEALVAALRRENFWIAVETNGSSSLADAPWLAFVDYVACSPKAEFPDSLRLERADEVRVVASSADVETFCRSLRERISATDWYISPCERGGNIDFASAKTVLARLPDWSLSVQLHKLLGFR